MTELQAASPVTITQRRSLMSHPLLAFAIATIAGASLFGVRWAVRGNADPFNVEWPLYLQLGSVTLTSLMASLNRRPFVTAMGVYCGFIVYLLADGQSEYPVASVIALTLHGLLPALTGAGIVFGSQQWRRRLAKKSGV